MRIWGTEDEHVFRIRKRKGRGGPGGGGGGGGVQGRRVRGLMSKM